MRPTIHPDIRNELLEIAPTLASMERLNPFSIPAQYFTEIADNLVAICQDESPIGVALGAIGNDTPFCVPIRFFADQNELIALQTYKAQELAGNYVFPYPVQKAFSVPPAYFEELFEAIMWQTQADAMPKEKRWTTIDAIAKQAAFTVPDAYFEEFEESLMLQIGQKNERALNLPPQTGFKVPDNYFDDFATNILAKAKATPATNAETNAATALERAGKDAGFAVPSSYFKRAAQEIMERIRQKSEENEAKTGGKVVQMQPQQPEQRNELRLLVRYALATAAMFAFVVLGLQFFNQPNEDMTAMETTAEQPKFASNETTANKWLQMSETEYQQALQDLSVKDVRAYVDANIDEFDSEEIEEMYLNSPKTEETTAEDLNLDRAAIEAMLEDLD